MPRSIEQGSLMLPKPAPTDTKTLAKLIRQRYELVQEIHQLSFAHPDMTSADQISVTLSILSRKEAMLDQLRSLHTQLASFQTEEAELRNWSHPEERKRCQQLAQQTDVLLREIIELDQRNLDSMQQRREAVAAQLIHGQDSRSAEHAYTAISLIEKSQLDISE